MTAQTFIIVIEAILCAALLVWFVFGPWQKVWVAVSRQHIFELRDQLFDMAADGKIAFSNPSYIRLREFLNGCIRFSHKITFESFLVWLACIGPKSKMNFVELNKWDEMVHVADEVVRREMRSILRKAVLVLFGYMALRSPIFWILIFLLPFFAILAFVNNKVLDAANAVYSRFRELILEAERTYQS